VAEAEPAAVFLRIGDIDWAGGGAVLDASSNTGTKPS